MKKEVILKKLEDVGEDEELELIIVRKESGLLVCAEICEHSKDMKNVLELFDKIP